MQKSFGIGFVVGILGLCVACGGDGGGDPDNGAPARETDDTDDMDTEAGAELVRDLPVAEQEALCEETFAALHGGAYLEGLCAFGSQWADDCEDVKETCIATEKQEKPDCVEPNYRLCAGTVADVRACLDSLEDGSVAGQTCALDTENSDLKPTEPCAKLDAICRFWHERLGPPPEE